MSKKKNVNKKRGISKIRRVGIVVSIVFAILGGIAAIICMVYSIIAIKPYPEKTNYLQFGLCLAGFGYFALGFVMGNIFSVKNFMHENFIGFIRHVLRGILFQGIVPGIIMWIIWKRGDKTGDGQDYSSIPSGPDDSTSGYHIVHIPGEGSKGVYVY